MPSHIGRFLPDLGEGGAARLVGAVVEEGHEAVALAEEGARLAGGTRGAASRSVECQGSRFEGKRRRRSKGKGQRAKGKRQEWKRRGARARAGARARQGRRHEGDAPLLTLHAPRSTLHRPRRGRLHSSREPRASTPAPRRGSRSGRCRWSPPGSCPFRPRCHSRSQARCLIGELAAERRAPTGWR